MLSMNMGEGGTMSLFFIFSRMHSIVMIRFYSQKLLVVYYRTEKYARFNKKYIIDT